MILLCLLAVLVAPVLVHAQGTLDRGTLENPGDGQHYSGIGVISGWHCLEGRVSIIFNEDTTVSLAYGNERRDVSARNGPCELAGTNNVGFGSIFNWALLGAGTHTAVVYHDGVEFARSTFTVGTTAAGDETVDEADITRQAVRDFPREGETTHLEWNPSTQHFEIADWEPAPRAGAYQPLQDESPTAVLENPRPGVYYSGIGFVSGWKCSAVDLTARVNGGRSFPVLYGNERKDTQGLCGDINNGFLIPGLNWAIWGEGTHTIVVYDQEEEFARATFTTRTAGEEFVEGVSRRITIFGFPTTLERTDFVWNESSQHFEMIGGPGSGPGNGVGGSGPSFGTATIADQTYTQNTPVAPLTLPEAGGGSAPLTYSLSPALPAGLLFNQVTRVLSGTPTSTLSTTPYTYTVTDGSGATATLTFSLTVDAPASPSDDHGNTPQTATPVSIPSSTPGNLEVAEDVDYFRVEVTEAGRLTVRPFFTQLGFPAGSSPDASLEDSSGEPQIGTSAEGDPEGLANYDVEVGTYYVRVTAYPPPSITRYTLDVSFTPTPTEPPPSSDDHPGNSGCSSGASFILLGSYIDGEIETEGDIDCFQFSVPILTEVIVYTTGDTDTIGSISGSLGLNDDDDGEGSNFQIVATYDPGSYTIEVGEYGNNDTGDYRLHVRADHANSRTGATYYENGRRDVARQYRMKGRLSTLDDEDWFKVWIPSGVHRVRAWSTGSTDTEVHFWNDDGSRTGISNDDSGPGRNFDITLDNVRGAGWLYLQVIGGGGLRSNDIGNYHIHITGAGRR